MLLVRNSCGGFRLILDARRSNANCLSPPGGRLLSCEGFGRIEVAVPEGVDVKSEEGIEALNRFSIAIVMTCVTVSRMTLSLSKFFCF